MGSAVLVSLLSLSAETSVLARRGKKNKESRAGMREEAKYENKLPQRDKSEISKDWMVRDE